MNLLPDDLVAADVRLRDHDRYLCALYAPAAVRPGLMALFALDLEMAQIVATTSEPMVGAIRLAWWREALESLDKSKVPAQPLLQALAAHVLPAGISGAELAGLEDRWIGLIGNDDVPPEYIDGGGHLFGWAARLFGDISGSGPALGRRWAGADSEVPTPVSAPLRPLLGLARLAEGDAARARAGKPREPRGTLRRQWRMFVAIVFGR